MTWFYNEKVAIELVIGRCGNANLLWSTRSLFWKGTTLVVPFSDVDVGEIRTATNKGS